MTTVFYLTATRFGSDIDHPQTKNCKIIKGR